MSTIHTHTANLRLYDGFGLETFIVNRLVPDALALVGPIGDQLLVFFCFSISVISYCRPHRCFIFVSLYSVDFYLLGDVALMS